MNPRRTVSVLLAAVAATMLVTGSFGFTSVSAERGVSVAVVDSENAYVNVSACEKSNGQGSENGNGANPAHVTVTNQFSDSFTVKEIAAGESTDSAEEVKAPDDGTVGIGDSATFDFKAHDHDHVTVEVTRGLDATVTAEVEEKSTCNTNGANGSDGDTDEEVGEEETEEEDDEEDDEGDEGDEGEEDGDGEEAGDDDDDDEEEDD